MDCKNCDNLSEDREAQFGEETLKLSTVLPSPDCVHR